MHARRPYMYAARAYSGHDVTVFLQTSLLGAEAGRNVGKHRKPKQRGIIRVCTGLRYKGPEFR